MLSFQFTRTFSWGGFNDNKRENFNNCSTNFCENLIKSIIAQRKEKVYRDQIKLEAFLIFTR